MEGKAWIYMGLRMGELGVTADGCRKMQEW